MQAVLRAASTRGHRRYASSMPIRWLRNFSLRDSPVEKATNSLIAARL